MDDSPRQALFSRINYERCGELRHTTHRFQLATMHRLVEGLGHPERAFPIVHIAGTKGKGSTANMLAHVLSAAGYKTGLYTSPHLQSLEERFWIDRQLIESELLDETIVELWPLVDRLDRESHRAEGPPSPTFFELTTAIAFQYFARQSVEIAVIEVGLGGRLDSTNVCQPTVTIINRIGIDHTHLLGSRIEQIAREKAGIIKPGVPLVTGVDDPQAMRPIREVARHHQSPHWELGVRFGYDYHRPDPDRARPESANCRFDYWLQSDSGLRRTDGLELALRGRHQAHNGALAMATCDVLTELGWAIDENSRREGLSVCRLPARVELICDRPPIVVDMAHNLPSLQALVATLDELFPGHRRILAFAISRDKETQPILELIADRFDEVVLSRFLGNPRSADPIPLAERLNHIVRDGGPHRLTAESIEIALTPEAAWAALASRCVPDALGCITGSTYFAAELSALYRRQTDVICT